MQYVGKVGGYVYNQWNSLNPATLSGAIDIIVIEQPDGTLHCSPWHVRFGKFQIIKPTHKKVDIYVNGTKTDIPMKLSDGGEAFFVMEALNGGGVSNSVLTSPVVSPELSPPGSPKNEPEQDLAMTPEPLDLNELSRLSPGSPLSVHNPINVRIMEEEGGRVPTPSPSLIEKAKTLTAQLNIPTKVDVNGDFLLDLEGYKSRGKKAEDIDQLFNKIFEEEVEHGTSNQEAALEMAKDDSESESRWNKYVVKDDDGQLRISRNAFIQDDFPEDEAESTAPVVGDTELVASDTLTASISTSSGTAPATGSGSGSGSGGSGETSDTDDRTYFKTLRLTSEQLQLLNLRYGENSLRFQLAHSKAQIELNLYLWRSTTPIVISDIDGTITKSDALGHVLTLIGKDWTHPGVAQLFTDIYRNGYNIMYLTARSIGQGDATRQYLRGVAQDDGIKLPPGPVILSPDRTMAALKREVILKKPEVFKMACLGDIRNLYFNKLSATQEVGLNDYEEPDTDTTNLLAKKEDDERTPFYAGFGNRITDAISYRSVHIPSHRIFTINPNGEVHMELLELSGVKSSYLLMGDLVDHFFPPIQEFIANDYFNDAQYNQYLESQARAAQDEGDASSIGNAAASMDSRSLVERGSIPIPGSPPQLLYLWVDLRSPPNNYTAGSPDASLYDWEPLSPRSPRLPGPFVAGPYNRTDERYTDLNYWREPLLNLNDLEDDSEVDDDLETPTTSDSTTSGVASSSGTGSVSGNIGLLIAGDGGRMGSPRTPPMVSQIRMPGSPPEEMLTPVDSGDSRNDSRHKGDGVSHIGTPISPTPINAISILKSGTDLNDSPLRKFMRDGGAKQESGRTHDKQQHEVEDEDYDDDEEENDNEDEDEDDYTDDDDDEDYTDDGGDDDDEDDEDDDDFDEDDYDEEEDDYDEDEELDEDDGFGSIEAGAVASSDKAIRG